MGLPSYTPRVVLSDAPGSLETVRSLLNTCWSPHRGEPDIDRLDEIGGDPDRWTEAFPSLPMPTGAGQRHALRLVRDGVRGAMADPSVLLAILDRWPVRVSPRSDRTLAYVPSGTTPSAAVLAIVVEALGAGTWPRLKACPECRWVFYDHSRNGSRVWCGMSVEGPNGRSCGAAVKMRAYRARTRHRG